MEESLRTTSCLVLSVALELRLGMHSHVGEHLYLTAFVSSSSTARNLELFNFNNPNTTNGLCNLSSFGSTYSPSTHQSSKFTSVFQQKIRVTANTLNLRLARRAVLNLPPHRVPCTSELRCSSTFDEPQVFVPWSQKPIPTAERELSSDRHGFQWIWKPVHWLFVRRAGWKCTKWARPGGYSDRGMIVLSICNSA